MFNQNITWYTRTPILAGVTTTIGIGRPSEVVNVVTRCAQLPFLRFTLVTDQDCNIYIDGSINNAAWPVLTTITAAAGIVTTTYDLAAPHGDDGYFVITMPMMRIRLNNPTAVDQTTMEFYASLSNHR